SKALLESSELFAKASHEFAAHGIKTGSLSVDLAAMMARKEKIVATLGKGVESLFRKQRVTRYLGTAKIEAPGRVTVTSKNESAGLEAANILIATGSKPARLRGVTFDGDRIGTSTEA